MQQEQRVRQPIEWRMIPIEIQELQLPTTERAEQAQTQKEQTMREYQRDNDLEQTGSLHDATRDRMQLNGNSTNSEEVFTE